MRIMSRSRCGGYYAYHQHTHHEQVSLSQRPGIGWAAQEVGGLAIDGVAVSDQVVYEKTIPPMLLASLLFPY